MKKQITVFQTKEGKVVLRTADRMTYWRKAYQKAIAKGYKSLIAVESDGTTYDYSEHFLAYIWQNRVQNKLRPEYQH